MTGEEGMIEISQIRQEVNGILDVRIF